MWNQIEEYCNMLGLGDPLRKRVQSFYAAADDFVGKSIAAALITETLNQDGTHSYLHVYFFNTEVMVAFTNLMNPSTEFSIARLREITVGKFQLGQLDFSSTGGRIVSRISATLGWLHSSYPVHVTDKNCDYFMTVYNKYIRPYLAPTPR